jgi:hypothetical protein
MGLLRLPGSLAVADKEVDMLNRRLKISILVVVIWASHADAASVEAYVQACVANKHNGMDQDVCECVGNKAKARFNAAQFDYYYAVAAKDPASVNKYNFRLNPQEKMDVIMYTMKGPSECASEVASQREKSENREPDGGAASSSSGAASGAAVAQ